MFLDFLIKYKWILVFVILILILFVSYMSFGRISITVKPENASITLDGVKYGAPLNKIVIVGKHKIAIESKGYEKKEEEIRTSSGTNKFSFSLRTNKEVLVSDMPKTTNLWSADYIKDGDFFTVSLLSENQDEAKKDFLSFVNNINVDPETITIDYDAPAIFDNKVGP